MNKDKHIEEMTKAIDQAKYDMWVGKAHQGGDFANHSKNIAKYLFGAGYRKQSEGEWTYSASCECLLGTDAPLSYKCSCCGELATDPFGFCPNCGAKMDGERTVQ